LLLGYWVCGVRFVREFLGFGLVGLMVWSALSCVTMYIIYILCCDDCLDHSTTCFLSSSRAGNKSCCCVLVHCTVAAAFSFSLLIEPLSVAVQSPACRRSSSSPLIKTARTSEPFYLLTFPKGSSHERVAVLLHAASYPPLKRRLIIGTETKNEKQQCPHSYFRCTAVNKCDFLIFNYSMY
jgi:hypothetical protein